MKNKTGLAMGNVSLPSIVTLFLGTLLILTQLSYITFDVLCGTHANSLYTQLMYQECMSYILAEFLIIVVGAFLFDLVARDADRL